jgi:hypothetical protein
MPPNDAVSLAYARGSRSGATGNTSFKYIVTNRVAAGEQSESFVETSSLAPGTYTLRAVAGDYFGNATTSDISFEIVQ